jgi:hypothetical protein
VLVEMRWVASLLDDWHNIANALKILKTRLACLLPNPRCLALLGWLFPITKQACQGKLAGFHIAAVLTAPCAWGIFLRPSS